MKHGIETVRVLTGPTASGKSALALRWAEAHGAEIVCMDSMQIYRGMDIGTAKPSMEEQKRVPHHMLDVADPGEACSVAWWLERSTACIRDIQRRGRIALLVGGTGLYLRALRHPMAMGQTAGDPALREALESEGRDEAGRQALHRRLEEVDPATAARLHVNDVRRVVRALEVYRLTGLPFSQQPQLQEPPPFPTLVCCLTMDRALLYARIDARVDAMLEAGLAAEVQALLDAGVSPDAQAMQGLGYKELVPALRGECTLAEARDAIARGSRHYAKRQLTWLRREEDTCWLDALSTDAYEQLEQIFD